jgi:hypothetical protein
MVQSKKKKRMASSGMLRRVVLEKPVFRRNVRLQTRITKIGELGTTLGVTSNRRTLRRGVTFLRNVSSYKSLMA